MGGGGWAGNEENLPCSASRWLRLLLSPGIPGQAPSMGHCSFLTSCSGAGCQGMSRLSFVALHLHPPGELHRIEAESGLWFPASLSCSQMSYLHYYIYILLAWPKISFESFHKMFMGNILWKNTGQPSISHESTSLQEISWFILDLDGGGSGPLIPPLLLGWGG